MPFHWTVAPWANPVPLTVRVNAALVAGADAGLRLAITGGGGTMGNEKTAEVAPPAVTDIMTLPAPPIRLAGTDAVS